MRINVIVLISIIEAYFLRHWLAQAGYMMDNLEGVPILTWVTGICGEKLLLGLSGKESFTKAEWMRLIKAIGISEYRTFEEEYEFLRNIPVERGYIYGKLGCIVWSGSIQKLRKELHNKGPIIIVPLEGFERFDVEAQAAR